MNDRTPSNSEPRNEPAEERNISPALRRTLEELRRPDTRKGHNKNSARHRDNRL